MMYASRDMLKLMQAASVPQWEMDVVNQGLKDEAEQASKAAAAYQGVSCISNYACHSSVAHTTLSGLLAGVLEHLVNRQMNNAISWSQPVLVHPVLNDMP